MQVLVKSSSEKTCQLKIESTNITVKEFKNILYDQLIKDQEITKQEDVCISHEKKILENNHQLSHYEISQDTVLTWFINKQISISLITTTSKEAVQIQALLSNTIQDIKKTIKNESKLTKKKNQKFQLVYNGNQLKQQKQDTLFDLGIRGNIMIHLVPIIDSTSTKSDNILILVNTLEPEKKKKKNRCEFKSCTDKIVQIIGNCTYCQHKYCSRHRLPEAHACINLTGCKQLAHERNSIKLLSERCVANKI